MAECSPQARGESLCPPSSRQREEPLWVASACQENCNEKPRQWRIGWSDRVEWSDPAELRQMLFPAIRKTGGMAKEAQVEEEEWKEEWP